MEFPLRPHTHLLVIAGSRAFGVHHADSDIDVKGVAIPPAAWVHGCMRQFEQAAEATDIAGFVGDLRSDERDVVARTKLEGTVFDLRKFLRLAAEANPNIIEVLFSRDEEIRLITGVGRRLRAARSLYPLRAGEAHVRWLRDVTAQADRDAPTLVAESA